MGTWRYVSEPDLTMIVHNPLEGFDVCGTRIDYDQLNVTHFTLLEVKCLYP